MVKQSVTLGHKGVTEVGGGEKNEKNSVMSFMNSPVLSCTLLLLFSGLK